MPIAHTRGRTHHGQVIFVNVGLWNPNEYDVEEYVRYTHVLRALSLPLSLSNTAARPRDPHPHIKLYHTYTYP